MNVRCCLLFGTIFVMHMSGAMHLWYPRLSAVFQRCACSDLVNEVCGSDDITYKNLCELDCASGSVPDLTVKSLGPCKDDYEYCGCPAIWLPVCASNGVTYSSDCDVRCLRELYGEDIHIEFYGVCSPEDDIQWPEYISEEVAGDDETYRGGLPCSDYSAPDRRCNSTLCESEERVALCGNNGVTYQNYCEFCCAYFKNPDFKIVQKGDCNGTVAVEAATAKGKKETKKKLRKSGD